MDKDEEVQPQQSSKAMDEEEKEEDQQQQQVDDDDDDDPYGFLVEQCIIPSAEENHLRSMPLFSPTPTPILTQQQQQPSPSPVVKHEQTTDEIDMPLEMKEREATENMEVDEEEEELQSVTKEPTISVENSPPIENEGFSQQTRDEPAAAAAAAAAETPSLVTGEELQKTIEEESPQYASLGKSPLEQNEGFLVEPQSPPMKTQTGQTHFVPPRFQPAAAVAAAAGVGVGVGPCSSSSSNPQTPKEGDNTTIDILDVLRSKGFYVPRPRWWRSAGYDKH